MRVTQSMLSNNMLRNLSNSYNKLGKLQEQVYTGKKVNRPSDDPVTVMKGMGYRMEVDKVAQFKRNMGEVHNWLDNTDDALDKVGSALKRANELVVNGSTDTMTKPDREKLRGELEQLQKQIHDLANTKVGNKYLFSGTKTSEPLYIADQQNPDKNQINPDINNEEVLIEVFSGITLPVNTKGEKIFKDIDDAFEQLFDALDDNNKDDQAAFDSAIQEMQDQLDEVLVIRADLGARQNRAEMMDDRLDTLEVSSKKQMSDNEDVDMEKAITEMITEESIHRAALSVGARIIQPSLVDFLR